MKFLRSVSFPGSSQSQFSVSEAQKLQNESSEVECGFYLTFQQTVVMSNTITAWAQQLSLFLSTLGACYLISAYRETVASASWQQDGWCDARPPLLGRIQTGFCSVPERRPDRLIEARRVPRLIHGACRERQRCFLENYFTKTSEPSGSRYCICLSGRMRMFGGKANNRFSEALWVSYLSVIQPRNVLFLKPLPGSLQVCFKS